MIVLPSAYDSKSSCATTAASIARSAIRKVMVVKTISITGWVVLGRAIESPHRKGNLKNKNPLPTHSAHVGERPTSSRQWLPHPAKYPLVLALLRQMSWLRLGCRKR